MRRRIVAADGVYRDTLAGVFATKRRKLTRHVFYKRAVIADEHDQHGCVCGSITQRMGRTVRIGQGEIGRFGTQWQHFRVGHGHGLASSVAILQRWLS